MERLVLQNIELEGTDERTEFRCRFVRAGFARSAGNGVSDIELPAEVLQSALVEFVGRACFVDHAEWGEYPSLHSLVGVTTQASWNASTQSVDGVIQLYATELAEALGSLLRQILADQALAKPVPDLGLSIVFYPDWEPGTHKVSAIRHVESVDFVFEPVADGRVLQALSAIQAGGVDRGEREWKSYVPSDAVILRRAADKNKETEESMSEETKKEGGAGTAPAPAAAEAWQTAMAAAAASTMIAASGLPEASKGRLAGQNYKTPEDVTKAIEAERSYLASLQESGVVQMGGKPPRSPHVVVGLNGFEELQLALDALLAGRTPGQGARPLTGIREAYHLLSGDYEMSGLFHPERVQFANVSSSTMAGLVANALNKSVVNLFQAYPRWWEPITTIQDFTTLQQVKWITLGGVGELPTVSEGAAYTEMTWDDQTETADFVKKGGYLGVTLEAIDKDDTGKLQAAPRAIAQAAWLALSKSVSAIFTSNSGVGPTLSDSKALFHTDHSNLGSTALSYTAWNTTRIAMRKHAELNSAERLGALTAPKFLLVPPDLEQTAIIALGTETQPAQANYNVNPFAEGDTHDSRLASARTRVIVVDLWTDATDWAAVADPMLYPTIGLAFRYGREPEIFSVASPTAGLMFTNDTMPIKARFFFATGPFNYRGLYKHNVA